MLPCRCNGAWSGSRVSTGRPPLVRSGVPLRHNVAWSTRCAASSGTSPLTSTPSRVDRPHSSDSRAADASPGSREPAAKCNGSPQLIQSSRVAPGQKHVALLQASKVHRHPVVEQERPLAEYMRLPASQYSVLDAKKIERIDEDTFRCYVGGLRLLGFTVEPVLTVSVVVQERGPVVELLDTRLEGSKAVVAANDRFTATMRNAVTWEADAQDLQQKHICSNTSIQVCVQVPPWARFIPVSTVQGAGSRVMQQVLNTAVPKFLRQLQQDYDRWASGDESRTPIGDGKL